LSARTANSGRPMRSSARRARISRLLPAGEVIRLSGKGRSSTARFGSDLLHGGPCGELRDRADPRLRGDKRAGFCGSLPPSGTNTRAARPILIFASHGRWRRSGCRRRSSGATPSTSASTARRRSRALRNPSGINSTGKASRSVAAALPG
jgi:hypothetical protein